jgi:hypothetical protein
LHRLYLSQGKEKAFTKAALVIDKMFRGCSKESCQGFIELPGLDASEAFSLLNSSWLKGVLLAFTQ